MSNQPAIDIIRLDDHWRVAAAACLTPEEESRAGRLCHAHHRAIWRAGRAWIRHRLSDVLGLSSPHHLNLRQDDRGRPYVVDAPPGFDCNWSHSGEWMALAINWQGPIGIDLEVIRPDFSIEDVAATVCRPSEAAALSRAATPADRSKVFYRLWTAKEALMKATGMGVALDPSLIEVDPTSHPLHRFITHPNWNLTGRESTDWVAAWTWRPAAVADHAALVEGVGWV